MAKYSIFNIYHGEKYDIMGNAIDDYLRNGRPIEFDERTWIDLLIVKHTIVTIEQMKQEGDSISEVINGKTFSYQPLWNQINNT